VGQAWQLAREHLITGAANHHPANIGARADHRFDFLEVVFVRISQMQEACQLNENGFPRPKGLLEDVN
jgi:hypothetical protein